MNIENLCMKCMNETNTNGVCSKCGFNQNTYQSPTHTLPMQSILAGKYVVGAPLGEGGFGITVHGIQFKPRVKSSH